MAPTARDNRGMVAQGALPQSTETLLQAVAAAADGFYVVDAEGRIVFLNPAALEILGYADENELLGKPSHETIHYLRPDGTAFPPDECPLLRPRVAGETVRVDQDWFIRKDQSGVSVSYSSAPVELVGGRGAVVAFRDISDRLRLGEVEASRARIVAAGDEARRQIERDLHDGAQQRIVLIGLEVEAAAAMAPDELPDLRAQLSRIAADLDAVLDEIREMSRGIHPALLTEAGLGPALKALARRSSLPVDLDLRSDRRLPEPVEVAAYYVVSEALANAAKHSQASVVFVAVDAENSILQLEIRDDGVGGAEPDRGSGLVGLADRIDALGGAIDVASPSGGGTSLRVRIPIRDKRRT
jgi:PAS domain S-box-containing protein